MTTCLTVEEYELLLAEVGSCALGALTTANTLGHVSVAFTAKNYIHGDDPKVKFIVALMGGNATKATDALDVLIAAIPAVAAGYGYQRAGRQMTSIDSAFTLAASLMSTCHLNSEVS